MARMMAFIKTSYQRMCKLAINKSAPVKEYSDEQELIQIFFPADCPEWNNLSDNLCSAHSIGI